MTRLHRRSTLSLLAAGTASLAGCSETGGGSDDGSNEQDLTTDSDGETIESGELPPYASLLRETDRSSYFYGAIAFDTTIQRDEPEDEEQPADPLFVNPAAFARLVVRARPTLRLTVGRRPQRARRDVRRERVRLHGRRLRDHRNLRARRVHRRARVVRIRPGDDRGRVRGLCRRRERRSRRNHGRSVRLLVPGRGRVRSAVEGTVATAAGEREPKHETDDEFARLLRVGDADGISLGLYTSDEAFTAAELGDDRTDTDTDELSFEFEAIEGAAGVHQQLSLHESGASASGVVGYRADDRVDVDRLESSFGTDAGEIDTVRDGTAVAIEAEYDDTALEEE